MVNIKLLAGCLVFAVVLMVLVGAGAGQAVTEEEIIRVNVGLRGKIAASRVAEVARAHGARQILNLDAIQLKTYTLPAKAFAAFRQKFLHSGLAEFVEVDVLRTIPEGENPVGVNTIPNDPDYPIQWGPPCIGAEAAWDYPALLGNSDVIVAVIDTGIDLDHPDLSGQVDTAIDYDFVNKDDDAMDDNGHGTHCAGIIAAGFNDAFGMAGLQNITLMAVKGLTRSGAGFDSVLAQCIIYAVDHGARVLSNSWGSIISSRTLALATYYAFNQGAVVVAAAGNSGSQRNHYPAAYPWVIGVAALEDCNTRAAYSNYGLDNVFIAAPGSQIWSTFPNDDYDSLSGTSMACPHVSAVAAMWLGVSTDLTPQQVMTLLAGTADDLGTAGKDIYYGWGRLDMFPWDD